MVQKERITLLNSKPIRDGRYVLYWMQSAQRAEYNHALEYAIEKADELDRPVVAFFGITDNYPEANLRHYHFMLEGLRETQKALEAKGIQLVVRHQSPETAAVELGRNASLVVVDAGQLRIQRKWRSDAAKKLKCPLYQIETNLIVPVEEASVKENFSAGTFRPRIKQSWIITFWVCGIAGLTGILWICTLIVLTFPILTRRYLFSILTKASAGFQLSRGAPQRQKNI